MIAYTFALVSLDSDVALTFAKHNAKLCMLHKWNRAYTKINKCVHMLTNCVIVCLRHCQEKENWTTNLLRNNLLDISISLCNSSSVIVSRRSPSTWCNLKASTKLPNPMFSIHIWTSWGVQQQMLKESFAGIFSPMVFRARMANLEAVSLLDDATLCRWPITPMSWNTWWKIAGLN